MTDYRYVPDTITVLEFTFTAHTSKLLWLQAVVTYLSACLLSYSQQGIITKLNLLRAAQQWRAAPAPPCRGNSPHPP